MSCRVFAKECGYAGVIFCNSAVASLLGSSLGHFDLRNHGADFVSKEKWTDDWNRRILQSKQEECKESTQALLSSLVFCWLVLPCHKQPQSFIFSPNTSSRFPPPSKRFTEEAHHFASSLSLFLNLWLSWEHYWATISVWRRFQELIFP